MQEGNKEYEVGQVYDVALECIEINPNQPRRSFDAEALNALKLSIEREGLLQPIALIQKGENRFYIAAGERRFRAISALGWATIPARIVEGNIDDLAIMENMIREDLNPMERAMAMERYLTQHKMTRKKLSAILGIARNSISEILSLNRLPQSIQDVIIKDKRYSLHNMRVIARVRDPKVQMEKFEKLRAKIEKVDLPKEKPQKEVFDLENKQRRLERISKEIKHLQLTFTKNELKQLKPQITNLRDQLDALRYKISDDIYLKD